MTSTSDNLTDTLIRATLKKMKPNAPRVEIRDTKQAGFQVRISHAVVAFYWVGRSKAAGKIVREPLGIFPAESCDSARNKARDMHSAARKGVNIVKAKREAKRAVVSGAKTVRQLGLDYLQALADDGAKVSKATTRNYTTGIEKLLGPYMDEPMDALDDSILLQLVRERSRKYTVKTKYGGTRKAGSADNATIACKSIARLCRVNRLPDPVAQLRIEKKLKPSGVRRGRLGTESAQDLYAWLVEYTRNKSNPPSWVRSARMLCVALLMGWRISTVAALRWEHIHWTGRNGPWLMLPDNKTDLDQALPIPAAMVELLAPLRKSKGIVFTDANDNEGACLSTFNENLPAKYSPHDARKAISVLVLQVPGAPPLAVKLVLGHRSGDVTVKNYLETTPVEDQVKALRSTFEAINVWMTAKVGHRPTLRALDAAAEIRAAAYKKRRATYDSLRSKTLRKARKERFAA